MMLFPWLQVRHNVGKGTLTPVLCEHMSLYRAFAETHQFILRLVRSVKQDQIVPSPSLDTDQYGIWLRRFDEKTAIVEYCVPSTYHSELSPEQQHAIILNQLCGEVLAPLSCLVLLDVDEFGGAEPVAELLAKWMRYLPVTNALPRPRLLAMSQEVAFNQKQLERYLTTELLCLLREKHPDKPYSREEIEEMWKNRVDGVQVVHENWSETIAIHLEMASQVRLAEGFRFSSWNFKNLLHNAIIASWENEEHFNIFRILGVRDPSSIDAVFHPELLFQSFVKPILYRDAQQTFQVTEIIRRHFASFVAETGQEITRRHLQRMRDNLDTKFCGCNLCLLGTPIHTLSCGHRLCSYCTATLQYKSLPLDGDDICILCGKENKEILDVRPLTAGIRTLELYGSKHPLRFLHEVRKLLFGHLTDYVDLVVGSESAISVIKGYFSDNCGLPQLSRELKYRRRRNKGWPESFPTKNNTCIAVCKDDRVLRNYGPVISYRRPPPFLSALKILSHKRSEDEAVDLAGQVDSECKGLWGATPRLRIQCHDRPRTSVGEAAGKLFSGLFYVNLVCNPVLNSYPASYKFEIRCRLPPGNHLNAVMHGVQDKELMVNYSVGGQRYQELLYSWGWNRLQPFSKRLRIDNLTPETILEVKIDSPIQIGRQENISNTPCRLKDLVKDMVQGSKESITSLHEANEGANVVTKELRTAAPVNMTDKIAEMDTEIDLLLDFCKYVWEK